MGILATRMTTDTTLQANGLIPVGVVTHRCGSNVVAYGNLWRIEGAGVHKVQANITVAPTTAGDITVTMKDNNNIVASAVAVVASANDAVTLPLLWVDYNRCGCAEDVITFEVSVPAIVSEADVVIEGR